MTPATWIAKLQSEDALAALAKRYNTDHAGAVQQQTRYIDLLRKFEARFGADREVCVAVAPGRCEISGNHTDHQRGRVLTAAISLDMVSVAAARADGHITMFSHGYSHAFSLDLQTLSPNPNERNSAVGLIRGVTSGVDAAGLRVGGFDAVCHSRIPRGSGLSSSAAFELMLCVIQESLYNEKRLEPNQRAKIGQDAENRYFGKPSGLLDQSAVAFGSMLYIDFEDLSAPKVERIQPDLSGFQMIVVNTGGNHAGLTPQYAAVREEMCAVARALGARELRDVEQRAFFSALPRLRKQTSDRSVLRAMHFFDENIRVRKQRHALREGRVQDFLTLVIESGQSSQKLLQNIHVEGSADQSLTMALSLSERLLAKRGGAWRVHGGGFAGTILAFVPQDFVPEYSSVMNAAFGKNAAMPLSVALSGAGEFEL